MSYFAQLDQNKIVTRVVVADQEFINSGLLGEPVTWVETFMDGSQKKNYAGIGSEYRNDLDAFIYKKPFTSWILDEVKGEWKSPVVKPEKKDGSIFAWDEETANWKEIK